MHGEWEFLGVFTRDEYVANRISGLGGIGFTAAEIEASRRRAGEEWDRDRPRMWREP